MQVMCLQSLNKALGKFSTTDKTSHCTMNVHHWVTQLLCKAVTIYMYMTASSHGEDDPRRGDCFGG